MNERGRILAAVAFTVVLFLGVQLGALALVEPFIDADMQAVDDPQDPANSVLYFVIILVMTGFMLAAFKYNAQRLIRWLIVGVSVMLAWFVFAEVLPPIVTVNSIGLFPLIASLAVGAGLLVYPEWYVIDTAGVLMGAGAAGLFGISFGLLPAIVLLVVLAVYDAISVYRTKHMLDLAEGVMDLKIPVVLVVPTSLSYSYLSSESTEGVIEDGGDTDPDADVDAETDTDTDVESGRSAETNAGETEAEDEKIEDEPVRDALFIGLGDAVIPTILVASAASFVEVGVIDVPLIALNVPALGAMIGTLLGLLALMYMVLQGRAHAGLPLLNTGAIGGYLIGALASGLSIATALGL